MSSPQPEISITYESGRYTATITWTDNSIITDGNTLDALMRNIDDAMTCHFYKK